MERAQNIRGFIQVLHENEHALRRFLTWRTGCSEAAADIFQCIAERLLMLDRENRLPPELRRAYLFRTASNEAVSYHRRDTRRARYESESAALQDEHEERSAERIASAQECLRVLEDALDELPLLARKIFVQYRVEGRKQKDIARELGLNLSTVEKHVAKATSHCRRRLRDTEIYGTAPPPAY